MNNIKNIVLGLDNDQDKLEAIFYNYCDYRKKYINKEIEDRIVFLIGNLKNTQELSYDNWSKLHVFLEKKYKNRDFNKCNLLKNMFITNMGNENDSLVYINDTMNDIARYREDAYSFIKDDSLFFASYFDIYITGDYLRLCFLEDIIIKEY